MKLEKKNQRTKDRQSLLVSSSINVRLIDEIRQNWRTKDRQPLLASASINVRLSDEIRQNRRI